MEPEHQQQQPRGSELLQSFELDTSSLEKYENMRASADSSLNLGQMRNSFQKMQCEIACRELAEELIYHIIYKKIGK